MSGFFYSSAGSTCPRFEEFDDWPSLQKIPELVDSKSAGLEESGATRIFNGFESLLIPGGRPNSIKLAIRRIISFGSSILTEKRLYVKGYSDYSAISWPLDQQGCDSDGSREDQVCFRLGSTEEGESKQQWGRATGRLQGERRDAISLEREASRACCRGDLNRPAEDGRVHVVEPRAREALKKGGGNGRLYSESMPELDSAKMIIDAGSSDNIASTKMVDQLGLGK
nr:hypothetical protein [Tanacetum cinerariifolium]